MVWTILALMALTQRLEFRQSQSLVMTPQLMQAIKLLQLSNLDLSAFVEEELERNPLLERANDGPEAPVAGEPVRRDVPSARIGRAARFREMAAAKRPVPRMPAKTRARQFEPGQEEWMNRDLGTRAEIEQTLDTGLDNVFSEEPAEAAARAAQDAAPSAYTEWGGGASGDEDYNLEAFVAAEVTLGDHLAEQIAVAFAAPAQRMIGQYLIDLVDEAGYLPADLGQVGERLGASDAADVEKCSRRCRNSIRPASARGISASALPSSCASRTATTPRCRRWWRISICWPSATSPPCANSAASMTRISPT